MLPGTDYPSATSPKCGRIIGDSQVVIAQAAPPWTYPDRVPFFPHEAYPELRGRVQPGRAKNEVYETFRELLRLLGRLNGRSVEDGNLFGHLIKPGQHVLVKPNLVRHVHLGGGDYLAVVTHASVVRCVLDYIALALQGQGKITVADAPVQGADFDAILSRTGLQEVCDDVAQTWGIPIRLLDLRLWAVELDSRHRAVRGSARNGDPAGYRWVDFGERSLLHEIAADAGRFRVTCYDPNTMTRHHNLETHEYIVAQSVLDADVVVNLPKLKTHRKVGLTAALKNLVGIVGHKDCLPHHRCGSLAEGGDEYLHPSWLKRLEGHLSDAMYATPSSPANCVRQAAAGIIACFGRWLHSDPYREGSWYGNDTLWRTVLDLNRLLLYADRDGQIKDTPQRRCITIVDAIIAGEGEGPMEPDPRPCGLLVGGANPVAVDAVLATLVGFDYRRIPLIARAFSLEDLPLVAFAPEHIRVLDSDSGFSGLRVGEPCRHYAFAPPSGWVGHVELAVQDASPTANSPAKRK